MTCRDFSRHIWHIEKDQRRLSDDAIVKCAKCGIKMTRNKVLQLAYCNVPPSKELVEAYEIGKRDNKV
jgi:hypothetical protein